MGEQVDSVWLVAAFWLGVVASALADVARRMENDMEQTTLKVFTTEAASWRQLAALRGKSMADLMRDPDVKAFVWTATAAEAARIQAEVSGQLGADRSDPRGT